MKAFSFNREVLLARAAELCAREGIGQGEVAQNGLKEAVGEFADATRLFEAGLKSLLLSQLLSGEDGEGVQKIAQAYEVFQHMTIRETLATGKLVGLGVPPGMEEYLNTPN
jgi:hypothetical protein